MDSPTPLLDRIEHKWRSQPRFPETYRRKPEWVKRLQAGKLPPKELAR